MRRIQPTALVLVELELWPNLIRAAKDRGAKVAIINGRLSDRSLRGYRRIGWLARRVLGDIDIIAAQSNDFASRFRALGAAPNKVHVTGSLKFDGAQSDRDNEATRRVRALARFDDRDIIFLAGSTQAPEEALALDTFLTLKDDHPRLKLIVVPRHPHRFDEVAALLDRCGVVWQRRTNLVQGSRSNVQGSNAQNFEPQTLNLEPDSPFPIPNSPFRILLVDTVGELAAWWGTATIGFVGGSLGSRGGQNMIEPAAYGVATCFGPNTKNFREIVEMLLASDAAVEVADGEELTKFVRRCLAEPIYTAGLGQRARTLVQRQTGATATTLRLLDALASNAELVQRPRAA
jgi:3-deoxy-D-manno-octulosonic-acid transferase